ncbi:fibronectin type III domain-containing protein [Streptomyces sp. NPDC020965]|uniref:fibronectin type III domain-containing protein n=1 Tax=Streptomyces sp. NPDC020965 TaxID=3365105 RepID=UPI00379F6BC3
MTRALVPGAVLCLMIAGCTGGDSSTREDRPRGVTLEARLDSPTAITLRWHGRDPGAAGHAVEFATARKGPYTVLEFAPPGRTDYTHPDLMPATPFFYRLRSYGGPVSGTVDITLPAGGPSTLEQLSDHDGAELRSLPDGRPDPSQGSVRGARSGAAAPSGLTVTALHANGVKLSWQDNARDEDGYLVEIRRAGAPDFRVAAVLDQNIVSTGLITLPAEKTAALRVRAFRYGKRSNVVHRTTGPVSPEPPRAIPGPVS